jgi:hypothetical protein
MWALKEFGNDAAERLFAVISLEQELSIQTKRKWRKRKSSAVQRTQSVKGFPSLFPRLSKNPTSCSAQKSAMSSIAPSKNIDPVGLSPSLE